MKNKIITSLAAVATGATILAGFAGAVPTFAATVSTDAGVTATITTTAKASSSISTTKIADLIAKSDADITARITALNALSVRVADMKNVSPSEQATITSGIHTEIADLTTLKAKIDADTDLATLKTDFQSVFDSYRIYALILPQDRLIAASDRMDTIAGLMNTLSAKLETRVTVDQAAGKDVTALQADLSDLNAKVSAAQAQASAAASLVVSLKPDQGDKTVFASNVAALKASRADVKTGTADFVTARQDAKSVTTGLKALEK